MAEARSARDFGLERFLTTASVSAYEVIQSPTGQAAFYDNAEAASSGVYIDVRTAGAVTVAKATGFAPRKGTRIYWDHSAGNATYKKVNDRDFYIGRSAGDYSTADNSMEVVLNVDPPYDIDLARDPGLSTIVGTAAAGGFGYPVQLGGALVFELTATSEAQKVDLLSVDGFAIDSNAIIEGAFRVLSDGAGTAVDVSIGIANATHATDADSITEAMFIHLDANDADILAESDDGTTEVAATDTTINYTEGSSVSERVEFWMDLRDPADIQLYIDGALVLGGTTFALDNATGPLFLLVHVEKSSSTDTYKLAVDWLRARFAEQ